MSAPASISRARWLALVAIWTAAAGAGMTALAAYKGRPGPVGSEPAQWPANSGIQRTPGLPTLVMFAHPMCPCTEASLAELARLMRRVDGKLSAHVLFIRPAGTPESWARSANWKLAAHIPGVSVAADPDSAEALRFGSGTSGEVVFYDAQGALRFSGGITPSRGHEGDNPGSDRIAALVAGGAEGFIGTPVFGCPLHDSEGPKEAVK
jgi:hypothetical protein